MRPLLEYCVQAWSPYKQKYIDLIEGVQERATRLVPSLRRMSYDKRLEKLKLTRLIERRYRGDMILAYNIITNKDDTNFDTFFERQPERGDAELNHGLKIVKKGARRNRRKYVFSLRVANPWNHEKREVVQAEKTSGFKENLDKLEINRRVVRQGRDERLYKLLYRDGVENVGY